MARKRKSAGRRKGTARRKQPLSARLRAGFRASPRIIGRVLLVLFVVQVALVTLFSVVDPPTDYYMFSQSRLLGGVRQEWVPLSRISPDMARAAVAAEDANFCLHWGFDMQAIRKVIDSGGRRMRGASTISQQVAKNVFLWPARSWLRKALEAETTLLIELIWSKRRIIEVYLNMAEMGRGIFGVEAAARSYFRIGADALTLDQAARLAAILPDPKDRSPVRPSAAMRKRARAIMDGARTIARDGRDSCFQVLKNT